jgi:hypothetical protein
MLLDEASKRDGAAAAASIAGGAIADGPRSREPTAIAAVNPAPANLNRLSWRRGLLRGTVGPPE